MSLTILMTLLLSTAARAGFSKWMAFFAASIRTFREWTAGRLAAAVGIFGSGGL
jgi:hypothetical protein